jgi:membrane protease YdiL (CAAX protease family)
MKTIKETIEQYAVSIYFILTFIITWGSMAVLVGSGGFPMTPEQFETVGPLVYLGMLLGPSIAGILMTSLVDGKAGLRQLGARLRSFRVGVRWYITALLATPLLAASILLILSLLSPEFVPAVLTSDNVLAAVLTGVVMGLFVGIFEELGWTGFAVPRMRERYGILATGVIVGILWGAWHFLPFWESDSFAGAFPLALLLARLFSWLPPYRILMVWFYDRTKSLSLTMLMHASLVFSMNVIVPMELTRTAILTWILVWAAVLWVIAAVIVKTNPQPLPTQHAPSEIV